MRLPRFRSSFGIRPPSASRPLGPGGVSGGPGRPSGPSAGPASRSLGTAGALAALALHVASAHAQTTTYPVAPSAVLDLHGLGPAPQIGGYLSVRQTLRHDSASFTLNRARITLTTAPFTTLAIRVQGDLSTGASGRIDADSTVHGFALTDAYVQYTPGGARARAAEWPTTVIAGQFKQPFSLEYQTPFAQLLTADRSMVVDRIGLKRDIGLMVQTGWRDRITLAASMVNGEGPNTTDNPDGRELVAGRLTLRLASGLAVAGKLAGQGGDRLRGYDARWVWRDLVLEGEAIHRSRPLADAELDAGGGYVLIAYRVRPWLEPVLKREWYRETRLVAGGGSDVRSEWLTVGAALAAHGEAIRLQVDWVVRSERPVSLHDNELHAQLVASF